MAKSMTEEEWEAPLSFEQEADIDRGIVNARDPEDCDVAVMAEFDVRHRMLLIELKTGQRLLIPQEDIQGISEANPEDLTQIEILGPGTILHWDKLMEAVQVNAMREGVYGSQRWMDGLAQRRRERLQQAS